MKIAADDPCGLSPPQGRQGHELSMARACVPEDVRESGRSREAGRVAMAPPSRPACFRSVLLGSSFLGTPPRGHVGQAEQPAENVYILRGRRPCGTSPCLPKRTPKIVNICS